MIQSTHEQTMPLLQALNRAAAMLQRESARSPQAVFTAFREQLAALGLIGSILAYDPEEERVRLETLVLPPRLNTLVQSIVHRFDLDLSEVTAPLDEVPFLARVIRSGEAQFDMRHRETTQALTPSPFRSLITPLLRFQDATPGITAPIIRRDGCWGVLGITGENLSPEDCPTVSAFANHLAIALDNATLLAEVKSAARFRSIFDQTSQLMGILTLDGVVLEVNDTTRAFLGEFAESMVGRPLVNQKAVSVIDSEAVERLRAAMEIASEGEQLRFEVEARRVDGSMRILDLAVSPIRDEAGNVYQLLAEARDLTEQRQATDALRHAQRTESLGLLAGGVAHDFNNLLVAMLGQTSLAAQKLDEADPVRRHVEKAALAAERASDLTRQLLAYAGQGQFKTKSVDLNLLVEENFQLLSLSLPPNIVLNSSLARSLPPVDVDPGQIQQVLINLVINARDAIDPQSGIVTIRTGETTVGVEDETYWQHADDPVLPGTYVMLEIADTGSGMDRSTLAQIFDPFFTTKPSGKGLGLSVVLGIMRSHSGGVRISSSIGKGTTFQLLFVPGSQAPAPASIPVPERRNGNHTVLVIDDDEVVGEAVQDILDIAGVKTLYRADGESGIELIAQQPAEIDLVLLDFSMPGLSGEETLKRVQEMAPDMPVLLSSGYDAAFTEQRLTSHRPVGFIQKPYRADTLIDVIRTYLP